MSSGHADAPSGLLARAESIAHEFEFKSEDARRLTEHFVQHMSKSAPGEASGRHGHG